MCAQCRWRTALLVIARIRESAAFEATVKSDLGVIARAVKEAECITPQQIRYLNERTRRQFMTLMHASKS